MVQKLRVCVIGGSGFIGVNLCKFLSQNGLKVTATARSSTSSAFMKRVFEPLDNPINMLHLDCLDHGSIKQFVKNSAQFDLVVNATGYAVQREQCDEDLARYINSVLPLQLLEAFTGHSSRFLQFGTSYEYGSLEGAVSEDMKCIPDTLYGQSKLDGTKALLDFNVTDTKLICLRMFGTFGPHETLGKLFPLLYSVFLEKQKVQFSHGLHKVDYMHVENVGNAVLRLIKRGFQTDRELYNIGSATSYTIREIAEMFSRIVGDSKEMFWGKTNIRSQSARSQCADITKIKTHIGWTPSILLEDGIRLFIKEHRDRDYRKI